jgi:hypothetical protein
LNPQAAAAAKRLASIKIPFMTILYLLITAILAIKYLTDHRLVRPVIRVTDGLVSPLGIDVM